MGKLTGHFDNFPDFKSHKLYVYCDMYEKIEKLYEMDGMAEAAANTHIKDPSGPDIDAANTKFKESREFDQNLMEWHKKQVENELNKGKYGSLDSEIRTDLGLPASQN